jgi:hypothetical protein
MRRWMCHRECVYHLLVYVRDLAGRMHHSCKQPAHARQLQRRRERYSTQVHANVIQQWHAVLSCIANRSLPAPPDSSTATKSLTGALFLDWREFWCERENAPSAVSWSPSHLASANTWFPGVLLFWIAIDIALRYYLARCSNSELFTGF